MSKDEATNRIDSAMDSGTKKKHKKYIMIVSVLVVILIAAVILYLVFFRQKEDGYNTVVTPDNVDSVIARLEESEITPIGSYEVVMNTKWTFPDGASASSDAYVVNGVNNQNTVFFTISPRNDDKNVIFTSPDIPVGSRLDNIKLENPLDAGEHDMVLTYHLIDENREEISSVSVSLTITIEN